MSIQIPIQKVAIQGFPGSFHQEAAFRYFSPAIEIEPCKSFRELARLTADARLVQAGVMAIENSIAGSILPNYTLIQKHNLAIIGEVYLQIRHQFLANPGVNLEDIREVHSHPMAFLQCMNFLEKHPQFKLIETDDTASSAKNIFTHKSKHIAAIASKLSADLYHLNTLVPNIHSEKQNFTRFLVLQKQNRTTGWSNNCNKASIIFNTDHSKGSLYKVLELIAKNGINLSKLQSMPIPGTQFKYSFHADLEFYELKQFEKAMRELQNKTENCHVFGVYENGMKK